MEAPFTFSMRQGGLAQHEFKEYSELLATCMQRCTKQSSEQTYDIPESFLSLPDDASIRRQVDIAVEKLETDSLRYVIVIGIGGSNLGTKAVYDALAGGPDTLEPDRHPKLLFLDTNDPEYLTRIKKLLLSKVMSSEQVAVVVITKSGTTTETVANAEYIIGILQNAFGNALAKRMCFITDEHSPLWKRALASKITALSIPKSVGGRYSVFSAVGLLPLALAGIDIDEFRAGAIAARDLSVANDIRRNPAVQSASVLKYHVTNGKCIHDTFLFHPEFESLGKWYRQLLGESIGKEKNTEGKIVHAGITPTVSLGSSDLHSVGQLYFAGPKRTVTTFVRASRKNRGPEMPDTRFFSEIVPQISGKSAAEIMDAIYSGVKIAYTKHKLPFMEVELSGISSYSIGGFMQMKMLEVVYLAELLNVNAFDQPNVESYKVETKRILMEE